MEVSMPYEINRSSTYNIFCLFVLQLLLIDKKLPEVHDVLSAAGAQIEHWTHPSQAQKEALKVFFLVLQVCHYLMAGQVRIIGHWSFVSCVGRGEVIL